MSVGRGSHSAPVKQRGALDVLLRAVRRRRSRFPFPSDSLGDGSAHRTHKGEKGAGL